MSNASYYPVELEENEMSVVTSVSLQDFGSLGLTFAPLVSSLRTIMGTQPASSGKVLYELNMRGNKGALMALKDGSGFTTDVIGTKTPKIAGKASLKVADIPFVPMDPTTLVMAVALANIEKNLDDIKEVQADILEFLQLKEQAKLKGNLNVLMEIMENYKHNWNNDKYKNNKHILVQEIKRDAEQSLLFYKMRIDSKLSKEKLIQSDQDIKKKVDAFVKDMKELGLSLYLFTFSNLLEIMLLGNLNHEYLLSAIKKNEDYAFNYRILYTDLYNKLEKSANSSLESKILSGVSGMIKFVGKAMAKVPVLGDTQLDEKIIESSEWVKDFSSKKIKGTIEQLARVEKSVSSPFINNMIILNSVYNIPSDILFDNEKLYLVKQLDKE